MNSKYSSTENLKITYYLGAGASYNALPIWANQGDSMVEVSNQIHSKLNDEKLLNNTKTKLLYQNKKLLDFSKDLYWFGTLAVEYGSIDIYARKLHLIEDADGLNKLKYCLSVYFDLWEMFLFKGQKLDVNKSTYYCQIDKRYFSLLSVILEKNNLRPKLNNLVSFVTWNYDLQLEMAYNSFLPTKNNSLDIINKGFRFISDCENSKKQDVIHLNGYRGEFRHENKRYPTVEKRYTDTFENYLIGLLENYSQFRNRNLDYTECIKYAWESDSKSIEKAKQTMKETDILIIIGYSFPSFNRYIDSLLIQEFENNSSKYRKIIYQDPFANRDIINSIFKTPGEVILEKVNTKQFYVPHEFLFPTSGEEPFFG